LFKNVFIFYVYSKVEYFIFRSIVDGTIFEALTPICIV
jgi:hypothetical protein